MAAKYFRKLSKCGKRGFVVRIPSDLLADINIYANSYVYPVHCTNSEIIYLKGNPPGEQIQRIGKGKSKLSLLLYPAKDWIKASNLSAGCYVEIEIDIDMKALILCKIKEDSEIK